MSLSRFEKMPAECRELVFQHLFRDASVQLEDRSRVRDFDPEPVACPVVRHAFEVFCTSKLFYLEARKVLASSMTLYLLGGEINYLHPNLKSFYFPLIRHMTTSLRLPDGFSINDMKSLQSLEIVDDQPRYDYMDCLRFPAVVDVGLGRKIMMGALDWSIKLGHRTFLTKLQPWLAELLEQPNRKLKIITALAVGYEHWETFPFTARGSFFIEYNLCDLSTSERGLRSQVGKKDRFARKCVTTWNRGRVQGCKPYTRDRVDEVWNYDEYQSLNDDPEIVKLRPAVDIQSVLEQPVDDDDDFV
jgi:hypothetical protein